MKASKTVLVSSVLFAGLALVAAGARIFWPETGTARTFTSIQGDTVEIYGRGLYANDSVVKSGATRGTDLVTASPFDQPAALSDGDRRNSGNKHAAMQWRDNRGRTDAPNRVCFR